MKLLMIILGMISLKAQTKKDLRDPKFVIEAAVGYNQSRQILKNSGEVSLGFWYRYPMEDTARLELGGAIKSSSSIYQFEYGKEGVVYKIESKVYFLNLGGRLVKPFSILNQEVEWISELTFSTLFFDGKDIPNDEPRESENPDTIQIAPDVESFSTMQFGQGLRIWKGRVGFGLKAAYAPYSLWYKNKVPNQFNVFSAEASILLKL